MSLKELKQQIIGRQSMQGNGLPCPVIRIGSEYSETDESKKAVYKRFYISQDRTWDELDVVIVDFYNRYELIKKVGGKKSYVFLSQFDKYLKKEDAIDYRTGKAIADLEEEDRKRVQLHAYIFVLFRSDKGWERGCFILSNAKYKAMREGLEENKLSIEKVLLEKVLKLKVSVTKGKNGKDVFYPLAVSFTDIANPEEIEKVAAEFVEDIKRYVEKEVKA